MFYNPVKVIFSEDWLSDLLREIKARNLSKSYIITSQGTRNRLKLDSLFNPNSIFSGTVPNPTFESCQEAIKWFKGKEVDCIVAVGGGSAMDTAKVVLAYLGTGKESVVSLIEHSEPFSHRTPGIFIPTTHGTGSEVTKWGTVWNMKEKKKHSVSHDDLYPDVAIIDGQLTLSLPLDQSIITTLDALSHGFEAIWNINANPTSTEYAIEAISTILMNVDVLKADPENLAIRRNLIRASSLAGLAFSNTKTAAAHSISYPLTIYFGIPHGIAASMPLVSLLKFNNQSIHDELAEIISQLNLNNNDELIVIIKRIPNKFFRYSLYKWGISKRDLEIISKQIIDNEKTGNNVVFLTRKIIKKILLEMYQ